MTAKKNKTSHARGGGKRTLAQIESDLELVAALYLKGHTQMKIAEAINARAVAERNGYKISHVTVSNDIKKLISRWRANALQDIDDRVQLELEKLTNLERVAWSNFEQSQKPLKKTEREFSLPVSLSKQEETEKPTLSKIKKTKAERGGENKFLDMIFKCISKRCDILGITNKDVERGLPENVKITIKRL